MDGPEVALAGAEHDGHDVHAHLIDQARGKHLGTDVAGSDLDDAVTRKILRRGHGCLDVVDEVKRSRGVPAVVWVTLNSPLSSNGTSPLDNQSNRGPGWSSASAIKPSTDTEPYMTTLPTGLSSAWGMPSG